MHGVPEIRLHRIGAATSRFHAALLIFFHAWLSTLSRTEYPESPLPVEQGVQTQQILFLAGL